MFLESTFLCFRRTTHASCVSGKPNEWSHLSACSRRPADDSHACFLDGECLGASTLHETRPGLKFSHLRFARDLGGRRTTRLQRSAERLPGEFPAGCYWELMPFTFLKSITLSLRSNEFSRQVCYRVVVVWKSKSNELNPACSIDLMYEFRMTDIIYKSPVSSVLWYPPCFSGACLFMRLFSSTWSQWYAACNRPVQHHLFTSKSFFQLAPICDLVNAWTVSTSFHLIYQGMPSLGWIVKPVHCQQCCITH